MTDYEIGVMLDELELGQAVAGVEIYYPAENYYYYTDKYSIEYALRLKWRKETKEKVRTEIDDFYDKGMLYISDYYQKYLREYFRKEMEFERGINNEENNIRKIY